MAKHGNRMTWHLYATEGQSVEIADAGGDWVHLHQIAVDPAEWAEMQYDPQVAEQMRLRAEGRFVEWLKSRSRLFTDRVFFAYTLRDDVGRMRHYGGTDPRGVFVIVGGGDI